MLQLLLPVLADIGKRVAGSLFPDPKDQLEREKIETQVKMAVMAEAGAIERAAANIIQTEAASQHWLAANWRPLTMLTFVALIVARWLGYSAPGLSEEEVLKLWDITQLGLGGYVIGRSAEKIVPALASALKK